MRRYRAIVFDIDGTAVPNAADGMPSQRVIDSIAGARDEVHLVAATGRPPAMALPVLRALGLHDPCVTAGGSTIIDPRTGAVLRHVALTGAQLAAIDAICGAFAYEIHIAGETLVEHLTMSEAALSVAASVIAVLRVSDQDLPGLLGALNSIDGVLAVSTVAWTLGHDVHITSIDASKEHGVRFVLDRLAISPRDAVGVGDGDNDLHLFASVAYRIAMGNAGNALKAAADEVVETVENDGLADVIDRCRQGSLPSRL